jgi:hypothetical protein
MTSEILDTDLGWRDAARAALDHLADQADPFTPADVATIVGPAPTRGNLGGIFSGASRRGRITRAPDGRWQSAP